MTNESEALEEAIARALAEADGITICQDATYRLSSYGIRAKAAARVIATALEARDAEIARLRKTVANPDSLDRYWILAEEIAERDARIAELEGALEAEVIFHEAKAKELGKQPPGADRNWRMMEHRERRDELHAILTKGKTHD